MELIMETLKDILTSYHPEPSAQSWSKLSAKLDVVMPEAPTVSQNGSPKVPSGQSASTIHTFWTIGVKIAATVIGAATTAAVVWVAVSKLSQSSVPQTIDTPQSTATITDTAANDTANTIFTTKTNPIAASKVNAQNTDTVHQSYNIPQNPTTATLSTNLSKPSVAGGGMGAPHFIASDISEQHPPKLAPISPMPAIAPISQPTTGTIVDAHSDPAIQSTESQENIDWSEPAKLEIPNVFTPNGDGVNDYFVIKGLENCTKKELIIRNPAGNIVYKSNSYENNWCGDGCTDGIYRYQLLFNNGSIDQNCFGNLYIKRK